MFWKKKEKLRVLILADHPNWAVNRNVDFIIKYTDCNFQKEYYTTIKSEKLLKMSQEFDLVHYCNSDISFHLEIIEKFRVPFLISIRSHRYGNYVQNLQEIIERNGFFTHVINQELLKEFPSAKYIPNGIGNQFRAFKDFVVGFSGKPTEYKGFELIKKACEELGVTFRPASGNISYRRMKNYYKSIDLLVSASINEGHCNPVFECMAMNKPVITTETSISKTLNLVKIERSVEGIKNGILKFFTYPQVKDYTWENVGKKFYEFYKEIVERSKK